MNKYHAKKVTYFGETFDSQKEGERWLYLRSLQKKGKISNLRRQVDFTLTPSHPEVKLRDGKYRADFVYEENGKTITDFPYDGGEHVKPVYKEFPGWKTSLSGLRRYEDFPEAFKQYISYIEKETGCRIKIVSVGPDRDATVVRY